MSITGLRGVGKTVVLNESESACAEAGWSADSKEVARDSSVAVLVGSPIGFAARWGFSPPSRSLAGRGALQPGVDALDGHGDSGDLADDLRDVLVSVGEAAAEAGVGLPAEVLHRLRRVAAFANPMFFERARARLSTHRTPRVIACHEERGGVLLLPRGCVDPAAGIAGELGFEVELTDECRNGAAADVAFTGALRPEQQRTVDALKRHDLGVLVAPPGAGKTVMAASLIAECAPAGTGDPEVFGAVAADVRRTQAIVVDVLAEVEEGRFPLVLTERRGHLKALSELLVGKTEVVWTP